MVSLYRPGPMEWIPSYIKRKHGKEKISFVHNDLKSILEPTYGIGIYQEQILQIAQLFSGYSLGEADILRRAIGKKIKKELDAQREKFINGATKKGYEKKLAEKIFDDVVTPFAGYGFNKSHAAGYARVAYETAYLKAHYPTEFMAALLSSDAQRTDRVMIEIEECRAMGIEVLPPDINESLRHFTALPSQKMEEGDKGNAIRFGLSAIKGIGDSSVQEIIIVREEDGKFESIEDFAQRVPSKILNKKLLECLGKSGALDSLGERKMLVENYEKIVEYGKSTHNISSAQTDLFAHMDADPETAKIEFPSIPPATNLEKLGWEKETMGMYISSHPLAGLKKYTRKKAHLIESLTQKDVKKKITLAGIVESVKKITTKKGETMGIVFLEDPTGKIEVTLFPRTYAEAAEWLEQPDTVLVVGGTLDYRVGQLQLRADAVKKASLSIMIQKAKDLGCYNETEAQNGLSVTKTPSLDNEEIDLLDEDGNVIAGETLKIEKEEDTNDFHGPLGKWISEGMEVADLIKEIGLMDNSKKNKSIKEEVDPVRISIHTIDLPERAPKKLLMDLKQVLEAFPGKEKVQLKIGKQTIPLPLTINMSTILEKKIEEVMTMYDMKTPA